MNFLDVVSEDARHFQSLIISPNTASRLPAIVLVQEIFGANDNMRWTAQRVADAGFLVVVPDLFWRVAPGIELQPSDPEQRSKAMELSRDFNVTRGLSDLRQTVNAIRDHQSSSGKVGAIGYCLGGRLTFLLAMQVEVDAAVCFYPVAIQPDLIKTPISHVPLLIHLGSEDALCKSDAQSQITNFVTSRPANRVHTHQGMGHGFARIGRTGNADVAASAAESESVAFLKQHLS
jgi:carboxymethylenebutenolidase